MGTTGLKAVLVSDSGVMLAEHTVRYPTRLAGMAAEQDANAWWDAAVTALRVVASGPVEAVAVTSQGPTFVPVDVRGRTTGPALTWIDRRATAEAAEVARALGLDRDDPYFGTAKLLWWRRTGGLDAAAAVLCANSFLAYRLSGVRSFEESTAGFLTGWNDGFDPRLERLGVPVDLLGAAVACTSVVGTVRADAAQATGLRAGTPVVAGAIDGVGAALEAGLRRPGDGIAEMTGFSTVSLQPVPRGLRVPGMIHTRHCLPGTDLLITAQVSTGAVADWVARVTGHDSAAVLDAQVPAQRPGRIGLLPSFAGERTPTWDPQARGALVGLDLDVTPGELLLAVFEGTALALRADLEAVAAHVPANGPLLCLGGGARSRHWPQIKADVLGRPVHVPVAGHGAAHGAAILAGLGIGADVPVDQGIAAAFEPDPALHAAYSRRMPLLTALRDHLPPLTAELRSSP